MRKFLFALFVATMLAGCAAPVRYVQVSAVSTETPAPEQAAQTTTVVTPTVVYVQQQPLYFSPFPVLGIAAGYLVWRSFGGYGGHHHRR